MSKFDDSSTGLASALFQIFLFSVVIGNFANAQLSKRELHVKLIVFISYCLVLLAYILSAVIPVFIVFAIAFPVLYGFGSGIAFMTANYVLSLYYPNERALMYGINSAAYGLGAGLWVLLNTKLNNPNAEPPNDTMADPDLKPFNKSVADNYPIA